MNIDKLRSIIVQKNEQLEKDAVNRAREIIEDIASLQAQKNESEEKIVKLRSELKAMEIQKMDEASILGA
jgi:hypothetical protein